MPVNRHYFNICSAGVESLKQEKLYIVLLAHILSHHTFVCIVCLFSL